MTIRHNLPVAAVLLAGTFLASSAAFAFHAAGGDPGRGKAVYEGTCVACHGADGTGEIDGVPDMTKARGPLGKQDAVLLKNVRDGFKSGRSPMAMPPRGGDDSLSERDIKDVIAYLHAKFAK